MLRLKFYFGEA